MGKHQKDVNKELKELREGAQIKHKRIRNQLKDYCSQSFNNLGIVNNEKNFETAERMLLSWFTYDKLGTFSQKMIELFLDKYLNCFDLVKEQTKLWKTLNKN